MNRNEALKAMIDGKKIKHKGYSGTQHLIYINEREGFRYINENGVHRITHAMDQCNGYEIYTPPRIIVIDGKTIYLSESSFQALKKSLID